VNEPVVTVTVTRRRGREAVDTELPVGSLEELFEICREVAPSESVWVSLKRGGGEVRLNFASFIRTSVSPKLP
jgi:hypothetical protein